MAIAGKVAITPKGEWNAQTAYTKLDLVFYDNASYVAIQPSTGVEPTNTSYWMLIVQSAGGADLEGIINGDIQVGNAKTLDGHGAEYFLPSDGSKSVSGNQFCINSGKGVFYDDGSNMAIGGEDNENNSRSLLVTHPSYVADDKKAFKFRSKTNNNTVSYTALHEGNYSDYALPIGGGTTSGDIEVKGASASRLKATSLDGKYNMSLVATSDGYTGLYDTINGAWLVQHKPDGTNTFNGTASGNLPLTNSTAPEIKTNSTDTFKVRNTSGSKSYMHYYGASADLGYLGFTEANKPTFMNSGGTEYPLLHTGNMADHVLPKTGGTVNALNVEKASDSIAVFKNTGSGATASYLILRADSVDRDVYIGMVNGIPRVGGSEGWGNILHTGNSAKVHIGTSAPSDTNALWIDTSA